MYVLRGKGGITAKKLAEEMKCGCSRFDYKVPRRERFVVNYGSKYRGEVLNGKVITDKLEVSYLLSKNGIRTPKVWERNEEVPDHVFPLLARKRHHTQGKDVVYVENKKDLEGLDYDYLIQYINKNSEYRVHVLGDYKVMVTVKIPEYEDDDPDPIVRSKHNGWKQVSYDRDWYDSLVELGIKTIKALKYDFGAIDIIRRGDRLYVLEVNSAPGLEPRKIKEYAEYFKEMERRLNND